MSILGIEDLKVNDLKMGEYQRTLVPSWARKIAREFNETQFSPLSVSRRADGDYVIDGQHRVYALRSILNRGDQQVPCLVYGGLTLADEVRIFTTQTASGRKPLGAVDGFRADWVAGDVPEVMAIVRTVEQCGLHFDWSNSQTPGSIRAVVELRSIYRNYGTAMLREALLLIRDTFGMGARSYHRDPLSGTAAFLARYQSDENYVRGEFAVKIGRVGLDAALQRAAQIGIALGHRSGNNRNNFGRALLQTYNSGKRTKTLPDWQDTITFSPERRDEINARTSGARLKDREIVQAATAHLAAD